MQELLKKKITHYSAKEVKDKKLEELVLLIKAYSLNEVVEKHPEDYITKYRTLV